MNNLDARRSRQANDSASIVKRAKERFRNSEMLKKVQQEAKRERRDYQKSLGKAKFKNQNQKILISLANSLHFRINLQCYICKGNLGTFLDCACVNHDCYFMQQKSDFRYSRMRHCDVTVKMLETTNRKNILKILNNRVAFTLAKIKSTLQVLYLYKKWKFSKISRTL